MWRLYLLRGYALVTGVGLFVLGMVGFLGLAPYLFIPQPAEVPENELHIGSGLIFIVAWWFIDEPGSMRTFLGGMGLILTIGKVLIVGARTIELGVLTLPFVGVVCLFAGVCSLLIALLIGPSPSA